MPLLQWPAGSSNPPFILHFKIKIHKQIATMWLQRLSPLICYSFCPDNKGNNIWTGELPRYQLSSADSPALQAGPAGVQEEVKELSWWKPEDPHLQVDKEARASCSFLEPQEPACTGLIPPLHAIGCDPCPSQGLVLTLCWAPLPILFRRALVPLTQFIQFTQFLGYQCYYMALPGPLEGLWILKNCRESSISVLWRGEKLH